MKKSTRKWTKQRVGEMVAVEKTVAMTPVEKAVEKMVVETEEAMMRILMKRIRVAKAKEVVETMPKAKMEAEKVEVDT